MKTLIFDFDGTIADSLAVALEITYQMTGIQPISKDELARLRHLTLLHAIRSMRIPFYKLPYLWLQGRQKMHQRIAEVRPFVGIPHLLRTLHERGHHLVVISTNSEQNVRAFLRANELETYFDGVYGYASLFNKAGTLRRVIRKNRLDARDCFYIGDEARDILSARRAHVEAIAVAWGYQHRDVLKKYQPFALLDTPADLLRLLEEKG